MENEDFISSSNIDIHEIWECILEEIEKTSISAMSFDIWIKTLKIVDIRENTIILTTPTKSSEKVLLSKYKKDIIASANKVYSAITNLKILVEENEQVEEPEEDNKPQERVYVDENAPKSKPIEAGCSFNPKYTFDSFIVGGSNQFAEAAAKAVAEEPGTKINPLFIYGGSGLGKTHLLHAIGNYIYETKPHLNVIYVTTDKFTNDLIASFQSKTTLKFREAYNRADVLIVDDIQSIINKPQVQEQFFNLFNELYQSGKQIVLTSDKQPKELNPLEERLRSRFEWGMLADIGVPDIETKIAILNKKAQMERFNVSKEVIEYIADISASNIRIMEGYLTKAVFYSNLLKEDIVMLETAKEALKNVAVDDSETVDATKIVDIVCKFYGVKKEVLLARNRTKPVAEARQIAMYLCTEFLNIPLEAIGNVFGKDHATVLYAKTKIIEDIKKSKKLEIQINDLKQMIEGK